MKWRSASPTHQCILYANSFFRDRQSCCRYVDYLPLGSGSPRVILSVSFFYVKRIETNLSYMWLFDEQCLGRERSQYLGIVSQAILCLRHKAARQPKTLPLLFCQSSHSADTSMGDTQSARSSDQLFSMQNRKDASPTSHGLIAPSSYVQNVLAQSLLFLNPENPTSFHSA